MKNKRKTAANLNSPLPLKLPDLSFFLPRRNLIGMELTGMAHFQRKQLQMRPVWRYQKQGALYLQNSIENFLSALTH